MAAKRLAVLITALIALLGSATIVTTTPASAARATCRTLHLDNGGYWWSVVLPSMTLPICYNGSRVWQSGNATPRVNTRGYVLDGIDWAGTYNGGGGWLGAGINYRLTLSGGWASWTCAARWTIDARGNVTSFTRC